MLTFKEFLIDNSINEMQAQQPAQRDREMVSQGIRNDTPKHNTTSNKRKKQKLARNRRSMIGKD